MEIIKIENPILECMDDSLNEQQCDKLLEDINHAIEDGHYLNNDLSESASVFAVYGATTVAVIIAMIRKWIKNKYSINVHRIADQSKEINDLYVKIEDLLKHDKMARFKHRNDIIDCEIKSVVLIDKNYPTKKYQITADELGYDPEYFIKEINEIMDYVKSHPDTRGTDLENMKNSLIETIDKNFEEYHWYTDRCEPTMKSEKYIGKKLEFVLGQYKEMFGIMYNNIGACNYIINTQMQYLQLMETAYHRMISMYGKDKDSKSMVDVVFKKLLKNTSTSIDFNSKVMLLIDEQTKYYAGELERIYNIIRS